MKIMITWQLHPGKFHDILELFSNMEASEEQSFMGKMKLIGRWHDVVRGSGAAVYEADSAEDISAYALRWNEHMDLDISVVLDDVECKAVGKKFSSGN
jgi:hypothetical protein